MNLNEHTTVPFFFSPMMLVTKTYICCCSGPLCLILQPIMAPPVERFALGSLSGVGSFFMGPAASVWVQWMKRCCENSSSLIFHEGHIPHTLPDASRRFPWENCISAFLTVSLLSIFFFFFFVALTPRVFFSSFRFFCQHFANIPEVRGHALHYGQDPSAWGPPSAALCRLRVNVFQMAVTSSSYCSATGAVGR